jgi:glutaredoxin-like YruB-family protein
MKNIQQLDELKNELKSNESVWLLLYKKGATLSECAFGNYIKAGQSVENSVLCYSDVTEVKDIHPEFKITSVPALLNFENGLLKNIVKGCQQPEQLNIIFEKVAFKASFEESVKLQKVVTVYTTPTCSWCNTLKRFLQEKGIRYSEVDVSADQKASQEMMKKSGQQGVPQTEINGKMIVGFDKNKINTLLGIN